MLKGFSFTIIIDESPMGGTYLELLPHAMDVDRVANTFLEAKPGNGDVALDEDLDETMEENENILNDMSSVSIFFVCVSLNFFSSLFVFNSEV